MTLATVGVAQLLSQMVPDFPPVDALLLMAVVYSVFSGGAMGGFVSSGIVLAYATAALSIPGQPLHYAPENLHRLLLFAATTPAMAVLVAHLQHSASRASHLQEERQRLREVDEMKTQFLNNAAHELRTPLTPLKLQMYVLRHGGLGPDMSERQQRALNLMERNVERLNGLVQDLLEVARLEAGRLNLRPTRIELARIVEEAAESFEEPARAAQVHLVVAADPGVEVEADAKRLIQVLFNLLGNAIKFTPAGGEVHLEARQEGSRAVVKIADTGAGMRAEDVAKLFHPFTQVHDPNTLENPGSGLGLYICRGIIEQHGGRIWAETAGPGKGATFAFTLPLAQPGAGPATGGGAIDLVRVGAGEVAPSRRKSMR